MLAARGGPAVLTFDPLPELRCACGIGVDDQVFEVGFGDEAVDAAASWIIWDLTIGRRRSEPISPMI